MGNFIDSQGDCKRPSANQRKPGQIQGIKEDNSYFFVTFYAYSAIGGMGSMTNAKGEPLQANYLRIFSGHSPHLQGSHTL